MSGERSNKHHRGQPRVRRGSSGHKRCGAVIATIQGGETPGKIKTLVQAIQPAVDGTKDQTGDKVDNAVRENIKLGVEKLKIAKPILSENIQKGNVHIKNACYDLDTGKVEIFE